MVDLDKLHPWRQGGTYAADRPESIIDEDYLRRHVSAALSIAWFAAERCATNDCIAITPLGSV